MIRLLELVFGYKKLHTVILVSLVLLFSFQTLAYSGNGNDSNLNPPLVRDKCFIG